MFNHDKNKENLIDSVKIQFSESKQHKEIALNKFKKLTKLAQFDNSFHFILIADQSNAFGTLKIALQYSIEISIENQHFSLTNLKNRFFRFELLYQYAITDKQKRYVFINISSYLATKIPCNYPNLVAAIDALPSCFQLHRQELLSNISKILNKRKIFLQQSSSITTQQRTLLIPYGPELVNFITQNPGIYVLIGKMGSGKSKLVVQKLFEGFSQQHLYPVLLCAKRVLAKMLINDERHYHAVVLKAVLDELPVEAFSTGVCGVINTLVSYPIFDEIFERNQLMLIEEIEDVLNHCYSKASGDGSIQAKEHMLKRLLQHVQHSQRIVITDSFLSDHTLQLLRQYSNLPVYICSGASDVVTYPTIRNFKDFQQIKQRLIDDLTVGKRVLLFTDCARSKEKSKFQQLFEELRQHARSSLQLDADNTTKIDVYKELQKNYQFVQISPVITSGVSFETDLFDKIYVFSKQTIHPLQLLQTLCRYRKAEEIQLHVQDHHKKTQHQDPFVELLTDTKTSALTADELFRLQSSPTIQSLVARKQNEIDLRNNYTNHLFELFELHGFHLIHEDFTAATSKTISTRHIRNTTSSKISAYQALLERHNPNELTAKDYFVYAFLIELCNRLNINPNSENGTFDQIDVQNLVEWIKTSEIYLSNRQVKKAVPHILHEEGCHINLNAKNQKTILNRIVSHFFGLKSKSSHRGKQVGDKRIREYEYFREPN